MSSHEPPPLESTSFNKQASSTLPSAETELHHLIGLKPTARRLAHFLESLAPSALESPHIKSYPDAVYYNYYSLGLSLQFHPLPKSNYRPRTGLTQESELDTTRLSLAVIDVYNHESHGKEGDDSKKKTATSSQYAAFPAYPIIISHPPSPSSESSSSAPSPGADHRFAITPTTTGRQLVTSLGEPDRKGGGAGGGSLGIWVEWTQLGLMVELASGGLEAWDKGAESVWRCCTIFERGVAAGIDDEDDEVGV